MIASGSDVRVKRLRRERKKEEEKREEEILSLYVGTHIRNCAKKLALLIRLVLVFYYHHSHRATIGGGDSLSLSLSRRDISTQIT